MADLVSQTSERASLRTPSILDVEERNQSGQIVSQYIATTNDGNWRVDVLVSQEET
jgi:hypothetical protein